MDHTPLLTLLLLAARARKRLARLALRESPAPSLAAMLAEMYPVEQLAERTLRDAQLLAFLDAGKTVAKMLPAARGPRSAVRELPPIPLADIEFPGESSKRPPIPPEPLFPDRPDDPAPVVRFPAIEKGADYLRRKIAFTPEEFAELDDEARSVAFTVTKAMSLDAVEKVRDALADDVAFGGTLKAFKGRIAEVIDESALAPHHVEALYRTHTARAHAYGQWTTLSHPLLADQWPYLWYVHVGDSRVRDEHLYLGTHGLNGTGIYRADDPFWEKWFPPCGWNCRCAVIPLSIANAAHRGVAEAIEWLRTGIPPINPQWTPPPPFDLPPGWVPISYGLRPMI